jgi:hypothetical protein
MTLLMLAIPRYAKYNPVENKISEIIKLTSEPDGTYLGHGIDL